MYIRTYIHTENGTGQITCLTWLLSNETNISIWPGRRGEAAKFSLHTYNTIHNVVLLLGV